MAMLVEPLDASITAPPALTRPLRNAFSRMCGAILSLVDPLGLRNSSLHQIAGSSRQPDRYKAGVVRRQFRRISIDLLGHIRLNDCNGKTPGLTTPAFPPEAVRSLPPARAQ